MTYAPTSESPPSPLRTAGHTTFLSPLGVIALEWSPEGLVHLHWGGAEATDRAPVPDWVEGLIARLQAHLGGVAADPFQDVPVDDRAWTPFDRRVLEALRGVEPGERVTYGELARRAGSPGAARAVGGALGRNPVPLVVPCHRVVRSDGSLGGFSAAGGPPTKARLLALESRGATA